MTDKPHIPVMLPEVLAALDPQDGEIYVDGTFGAGGYTRGILNAASCRVTAIDRDPAAAATAKTVHNDYGDRFAFCKGTFGNVENLLNGQKVDGFVLDIGVSSMQIDQADRGFSFRHDGPLDMRMGNDTGETAADLIARLPEEELADILYTYGEERKSRRIAKAIKEVQAENTITTTAQLVQVIEKANPRTWRDKIHPATRSFQALRIAVNDELGELERALKASIALLKPGGRLVVVTFHSLEDRIVKQFLKKNAEPIEKKNKYSNNKEEVVHTNAFFRLLSRKAVQCSDEEAKINPRARSAKLRGAIRL